MSSRDELREALADQIKEVHRGPAATYEDLADAVLAFLDQQGWPQDCPTVEAAEPATPVGTASLLGTPLADQLLSTIEVGLVANLRHPVLTCNEGLDEKCFTCEALTAVASLRVALREAARYEPTSFGDPWHPWNVEYVAQEHPNGCGIACLAMVARMTYAEVRDALAVEMPRERDYGEEGIHSGIVENFLGRRGFAWRTVYSGWRLDEWPPAPFAPIHIAQVKQPSGYTHFVVMLADGSVYDPLSVEERTLADWSEVNNVFGFWPLYRRVTTAGED